MSLSVDGVWKAGVWATTVWADGVWREGAPPPPTPTPAVSTVSAGGATRIFGPVDWSRFDALKKRVKKKSKKALQIVEAVAAEQQSLSAALSALEVELVEAQVTQLKMYRELLEMELAIREDEEDDDLLLMH